MVIYSIVISLLLGGQQLYAAEAYDAQEALFNAVEARNEAALRGALTAGANPLMVDPVRGESPIHALLKQRVSEQVIYPLLALMVDQVQKPVARASVENRIRGFLRMPQKTSIPSINFNIVDVQGETPFMYAVRNGHVNSGDLLKRRGANPNHPHEGGHTVLHKLVQQPSILNHQAELERALSLGVDINAFNAAGRTALIEAVLAGNNAAVEYLLTHSPADLPKDSVLIFPRNVEVRDASGKRAVDYAREAAAAGMPLVEQRILDFLEAASQ